MTAARVQCWERKLTRFSDTSDLSRVNADPAADVVLSPTLAAVLSHALDMQALTEGTVDVAMLDHRIAVEFAGPSVPLARGSWDVVIDGRRRRLTRRGRVRFDLDGVAKGWIADRALRLLGHYDSALVDADGDVAMRAAPTADWRVAIGHPDDDGVEVAALSPPRDWPVRESGVATSGTSVHRWHRAQGSTHHLIDPLTGQPALSDVVQATVVARSAAAAECLAKSAVIRGSERGFDLLERGGAWAAVLVLVDGDVVCTPRSSRWLA